MFKQDKNFQKENYSNRFLKKKIDILFNNTLQKYTDQKINGQKKIKRQINKEKKDKKNNFTIRLNFKIYFFILIFLFGGGLLFLKIQKGFFLNFDLFYWFHKTFAHQQPLEEIYLNKKFTLESHHPIYSTAAIADLNNDGSLDFIFANTIGEVYAIDGNSSKKIYHFSSGGTILASLNFVKLKKQKSLAAIVANDNGDFFVLNSEGDYFYDTRKELIEGALRTKPVVNPNNQDIYLATAQGVIVCLESNYGFVKWKNEIALQADRVFAVPLLLDINHDGHLDIVVASLSGNTCALNGKDGTTLWINTLATRVKSSPIILTLPDSNYGFSENKILLIVSTTGEAHLLNPANGKIIRKKKLANNGAIVSTAGKINNPHQSLLCFTTQTGEMLIYTLKATADLEMIFVTQVGNCYLSSPLICDLDSDSFAEIILVSREGIIDILSSKKNYQSLGTSFALGYKVTATPLLADLTGNRQLELICSGEDGKVSVLQLTSKPKIVFPKNKILYGEFLKDD